VENVLIMRDHILDTAARLFYLNGIRAVGVDRVIAEAKIAKATLYRHFPTKEDLIVAYLQTRSARVLESLRLLVADTSKSPKRQVAQLFKGLEELANSVDFRGCAFMLAIAEHEESEAVRIVVRSHKDAVKEVFHSIAIRIRTRGAKALSDQLALLYDGALASILIYRDASGAKNAMLIAAMLVQAAEAEA
jgi:AcrR family transcriptional regulator